MTAGDSAEVVQFTGTIASYSGMYAAPMVPYFVQGDTAIVLMPGGATNRFVIRGDSLVTSKGLILHRVQ